jgi:hypothetical protein
MQRVCLQMQQDNNEGGWVGGFLCIAGTEDEMSS